MSTRELQAECPALLELVEHLDALEGPAELEDLSRRLRELDVCRESLGRHVRFQSGHYKRNEISSGEWYEMLALCGTSGQASPIHDHKGSGCAFLVVEGPVTEVVYQHSASGLVVPECVNEYETGDVCASFDCDTHMLANTQPPGRDMITLHIYTPRLCGIRVYDATTTEVSVFEG